MGTSWKVRVQSSYGTLLKRVCNVLLGANGSWVGNSGFLKNTKRLHIEFNPDWDWVFQNWVWVFWKDQTLGSKRSLPRGYWRVPLIACPSTPDYCDSYCGKYSQDELPDT